MQPNRYYALPPSIFSDDDAQQVDAPASSNVAKTSIGRSKSPSSYKSSSEISEEQLKSRRPMESIPQGQNTTAKAGEQGNQDDDTDSDIDTVIEESEDEREEMAKRQRKHCPSCGAVLPKEEEED